MSLLLSPEQVAGRCGVNAHWSDCAANNGGACDMGRHCGETLAEAQARGCLCEEIHPADRPCIVCEADNWSVEKLKKEAGL